MLRVVNKTTLRAKASAEAAQRGPTAAEGIARLEVLRQQHIAACLDALRSGSDQEQLMADIEAQIRQLSRAERITLVQRLWDELAAEADPFELTAAQAAELDRRLNAHQANPQEGSSLDEIAEGLGIRL
jgi:putative addiction module component (TIGR02574 family)